MQVSPKNSLISTLFSKNVTDLRSRASTVAEEAVTGRYADLTKQLSGSIGKAMIGQKALEDINAQREQLTLRDGRLSLIQYNLASMHDRTLGLDVKMLSALGTGDDASRDIAARDAAEALRDVFSSLNARFGERYLFAGDATATQPLSGASTLIADIRQIALTAADPAEFEAAVDTYFNDPAGGWQQTIYGGTPTSSDPEGMAATDPAILELVSGLAIMAISGASDAPPLLNQNPEIIRAGAERLLSGRTAITNLRADLGVMQERIAQQQTSLDSEETLLTGVFNSLTARDQYEAASELKILESSLEAAYMLTARLSQLNLLNFLR